MKNKTKKIKTGLDFIEDRIRKMKPIQQEMKRNDFAMYKEGWNDCKKEKEINIMKIVDDVWEELLFDLHVRICKIDDIGSKGKMGKTQQYCRIFKEDLKKQLKDKLSKEVFGGKE